DAVGVREVVAGVDHEVRLQRGQRAEPADLPVLAGDHVDVGDLENAQLPDAPGQYRDLVAAEAEEVRLDLVGVGQPRRGGSGEGQGDGHELAHPSIISAGGNPAASPLVFLTDWGDTKGMIMAELKEKLRADLTAAMKSRDELVTATLRMALTAVGN